MACEKVRDKIKKIINETTGIWDHSISGLILNFLYPVSASKKYDKCVNQMKKIFNDVPYVNSDHHDTFLQKIYVGSIIPTINEQNYFIEKKYYTEINSRKSYEKNYFLKFQRLISDKNFSLFATPHIILRIAQKYKTHLLVCYLEDLYDTPWEYFYDILKPFEVYEFFARYAIEGRSKYMKRHRKQICWEKKYTTNFSQLSDS